nr:GTPase [Nostoc sp. ZfuVER08]
MSNLNDAVQQAIQKSQSALQDFRRKIESGLSRLNQAGNTLKPWTASQNKLRDNEPENASSQKVADQFITLINEVSPKVKELFNRQQQELSTFKIVLFGRTGVGKSTLIEAFVGSNGNTVSLGESDWTTEVAPKKWNSCVFVDTPGIGGWGRTNPREQLEQKAQHAVETADLVLLCFDNQNHTAYEFKQVANWIQKYGKPVIVVFNSRNRVWRMPYHKAATTERQRKNISQQVQQHTDSIRDELEKMGMFDVPIVALSSQRALYARIKEPFDGPYKENYREELVRYRNKYGTENLEKWSNFRTLEALIIEAVSSNAEDLRLGMLREQTCGVLSSLKDELRQLQQEAQKASFFWEDYIKRNLNIVGYPQSHQSFPKEPGGNVDLLTKLEKLREEPFQAPIEGEYQVYTKRLLSVKLEPLRSESLNKTQQLVLDAFDKGQRLSEDVFKNQVFNSEKIQQAANSIVQEAGEYLQQKLELERKKTDSDVTYVINATKVDGNINTGWQWANYAAIGGGFLGSAASVLGSLALANIWNPFGWAAGVATAVTIVGGFASFAFRWFSDHASKEAEKTRLSKRREALSQVFQAVNETYDNLTQKITEETSRINQTALVECLAPVLRNAIALRLIQQETQSTKDYLRDIINQIPRPILAQKLLSRAANSVEQKCFPHIPNSGRKLWLGEDWISDPSGLKPEDSTNEKILSNPINWVKNVLKEQPFKAKFSQIVDYANSLQPGIASKWLNETRQILTPGDDEITKVLNELDAFSKSQKARLHLYGDWNTGKTSFIKRLIIDTGLDIPENLEVQANPTTTIVEKYEWKGIWLVDNPGFQSTRANDTDVALESLADASAIIYLFNQNLIVGDTSTIDLILKGDERRGILPKKDRTFFIINRCDQLGVDPTESPKEYARLCKRKREELFLALASRGISISVKQIFCMSSDPYGLVGNRRDVNSKDFNPYREWDGFDSFINAFISKCSEIQKMGTDWLILEAAVARFSNLIGEVTEAEKNLKKKEESINQLCQILSEAIEKADRIKDEIKIELRQIVNDHTTGLVQDTLSAIGEAEIQAQAKLLSQWWTDKAFQYQLTQWHKKAQYKINEWIKNTESLLERRIASSEFQDTFQDISSDKFFESEHLIPKKNSSRRRVAKLIKNTAKMSAPFADDIAVWIGNVLHLTPKLVPTLAQGLAWLPMLGLIIDISYQFNRVQERQKREDARKNLTERIKQSTETFCSFWLEESNKYNYNTIYRQNSSNVNVRLPIGYLQNIKDEFNSSFKELSTELQKIETERLDRISRRDKYEYCRNTAYALLTNPRFRSQYTKSN